VPNVARLLSTPALAALLACSAVAQVRPPAVPLITHDPYFSIWSDGDRLTDSATRHWTGSEQPLVSLIRIDGKVYRLMGASPVMLPALPQKDLKVTPTRTTYTFDGAGTTVQLTFTTPTLPDDIDVLSRPASYLTWNVRSSDGQRHDVAVYFDADAMLAVNVADQKVVWGRERAGSLSALRIGSEEQPVLAKRGDNLRIDWGHVYVAGAGRGYVGGRANAVESFLRDGSLPRADERSTPRAASEGIAAAFTLPFGKIGSGSVSKHLIVAYDDLYSIQYFHRNLRPYWRRNGMDANGLLRAAERDYASLTARCEAFDRELTEDLTRAGGPSYAAIASLAYRQSFAAQKVVADANGQPLMFSKENFSNGCIGTVDVLYPAAPQLLLFSPTLTKASLVPILNYASSERWRWPFAPHDLGQYPKANGQVYGGGERTEENQMPVEETGNMLILLAALAKEEGNANFAGKYWPTLSKWAAYLADKGFDPESQLSTDDFAGHLAHNVNLSAKAIEALGAYSMLADMRGLGDEATKYRTLAKSFADRWVSEAKEGDHYRLAFDKPGTWSQKYNLVWDRILGLNLFPTSVAKEEMAYYRQKINAYGLPLDNRADYTKLDWIVWTATLTGSRDDFQTLVDPVARFLNETQDRVPMSDWYFTSRPRQRGFQARSVVGGVFVKLLDDPAVWRKYVARDHATVGNWAPIPTPPIVTTVVPTAAQGPVEWSYTFTAPSENWFSPTFDDSGWRKGNAGFGSGTDNGGAQIRTEWTSDDIWIRRSFELPAGNLAELQLTIQHDDDADIYINGVLAARLPGANRYETIELPKAVLATLKPGRNVVAIHCRDTGGDQFIDAGFVTVTLR
jgi:hypothetical protein